MNIKDVRLMGQELTLTLDRDGETMKAVRQFVHRFKPGRWTLKQEKQRRSLDANAYAWVLINMLAKELDEPPLEIYRRAIKSIGGVSRTGCFRAEDVPDIKRTWESNGIGWQCDTVDSKLSGCVNVILYYGSSVYDRGQMSRLIDHLMDECRELDIETRDPADVASMLEAWE